MEEQKSFKPREQRRAIMDGESAEEGRKLEGLTKSQGAARAQRQWARREDAQKWLSRKPGEGSRRRARAGHSLERGRDPRGQGLMSPSGFDASAVTGGSFHGDVAAEARSLQFG